MPNQVVPVPSTYITGQGLEPGEQPADRRVLRAAQDLPADRRVARETSRQWQVDVVEGAGAAQQGGGSEPGDGGPRRRANRASRKR
jgi:hypothetical protein